MLPSIAAERRQNVAPGASPGFSFETISAPEGRKSPRNLSPRGYVPKRHLPRACARGYTLSPLRG